MNRAAFLLHQRGQATTEFVVVALVLVPFFLLVVLAGKLADITHTAQQASRYAAFEGVVRHSGTGWKSDVALAAEVRRRFFSHPDAPLKTDDVAGDFTAHRNPLWSDPAGRPLLARLSDTVGVSLHIDRYDALPAAAYADELGLPDRNLSTASVTVRPSDMPALAPFDVPGLHIERHTALLADAWTARDATGIRARIAASSRVLPTGPITSLIDAAGRLPTLVFDPALRMGEFDWDVVPCDRLIGGC
jgi:hypothetical protein